MRYTIFSYIKISSVIFLSVFLFSNCSKGNVPDTPEEKPDPIEEVKSLSLNGTQLINSDSDPVILRGVSYGWHNWWLRFYNKESVKWLKNDWNVQVVRAAIGIEPDGGFLADPTKAYNALYAVIDAAIENNIYVLVDWHAHDIHTEEAKAFFKTVSSKYKNTPNILYEIYNEPVDQTWSEVKAYAEEVIEVIREHSGNIIIVGTPHWGSDIHIAADNPITGYDDIMYTMHFYAATSKQELRNRGDYALDKGLAVFVTECGGMESSGDGRIDVAEWDRWVRWLNRNKISHVMWSIADKNETCSMILPNGASVGNWNPATHMSEWGRMVRTYLKNPVVE